MQTRILIIMAVACLSSCYKPQSQLRRESPDGAFIAHARVIGSVGNFTNPSVDVEISEQSKWFGYKFSHGAFPVFRCVASEEVDLIWDSANTLTIETGCSPDPKISYTDVKVSKYKGIDIQYRYREPDYPLSFGRGAPDKTSEHSKPNHR
jgi:hypothetical protein